MVLASGATALQREDAKSINKIYEKLDKSE